MTSPFNIIYRKVKVKKMKTKIVSFIAGIWMLIAGFMIAPARGAYYAMDIDPSSNKNFQSSVSITAGQQVTLDIYLRGVSQAQIAGGAWLDWSGSTSLISYVSAGRAFINGSEGVTGPWTSGAGALVYEPIGLTGRLMYVVINPGGAQPVGGDLIVGRVVLHCEGPGDAQIFIATIAEGSGDDSVITWAPLNDNEVNPTYFTIHQQCSNDSDCDDNSLCTQDHCVSGSCQPGTPVNCDDGDGCTVDTCDPQQGCLHTPIPNCECDSNSDCTDYNVCTGTETCVANDCVAGTPLNCNDGNVCTNDSCDAQAGCQHLNNTSACDDGSVCITGDHCVNGTCQGTGTLNCDDGDGCTTDTCDPQGGCLHTPIPNCECDSASDCTDNNVCTGTETCVANDCVAGTPLNCDDGNVCTNDSCDVQAGCQHVNNTSACNDGSVCTAGEQCLNGLCQGGVPISCDDGDVCTTDTCDPQGGCIYTPIPGCECDADSDCDDDNVCTGTETCDLGNNKCVAGTPLVCDDRDGCTDDNCDSQTGCYHSNNSLACDDGDACTAGERCANGVCEGGAPISCDDGNPCTDDTCDSASGCIHTPISGCVSTTTSTIAPPPPPPPPKTTTTSTIGSSTTSSIRTTTTTTIKVTTTTTVPVPPPTTTITPSTTTTTVATLCPVEQIYGRDSAEVQVLRYVRDNVLSKTPEGQRITELYYQWSPVVSKALREDKEFKKKVKSVIDGLLRMELKAK